MPLSQSRLRELLLLAAACGFFFFFRLSAIGFVGPDEPRYAQVAREMLARRDWVTPVLYHHTWLEKPILLYWGEMVSYRLFGVSDWAARVPSAVAATLLVAGVYLAVGRIRPQARLDAALMVASSVLFFGFARAAATDMLLASPWCLSLLAWFCWYESWTAAKSSQPEGAPVPTVRGAGRGYLYLFYALNGVAMLAKGPVAPGLAALVLIAFCAARCDFRTLLRSLDPVGIALFALVAAPWYVLVQLRTPEFFRIFFLQHNLERFGSNLYRHKQPFWYYLPVALIAALPWTVWVLHGVADGFRTLRRAPRSTNGSAQGDPLRVNAATATDSPEKLTRPPLAFELYLLLWALVPIVFFSISRSKLPGYILPAVPALLMLAAVAVHRRAGCAEAPNRIAVLAHAVLLGILAAAALLAPRLMLKLPLSASVLAVAALAGAAILLLATLALLWAGWRSLRFVTLLPVILIVGFVLRGLAPVVDATQSARPVAQLLQQMECETQAPVATFGFNRNMAFGLAFYLNRRVDPYEGLEISPAVFELPPAVPNEAHLLVVRDASLRALPLMLTGRTLERVGSYAPQHVEIYRVSATP